MRNESILGSKETLGFNNHLARFSSMRLLGYIVEARI